MCRCSVPRGWDPGVIWPGHRRHSTLIFYLRFIPPSPWDEAGQDKRNPIQSFFLFTCCLRLVVARTIYYNPYALPKLKISTHFIKSWLKTENMKFYRFSALLSLNTLHSISGSNVSSWLAILGSIQKNVNLNRAQHIVGRIPSGLHSAEGRKWWGFGQWCEQWLFANFSVISVKVCPHPSIRDSSHNKSSQKVSMVWNADHSYLLDNLKSQVRCSFLQG